MPWKFSMASDIGGRSEQQDCMEMLCPDNGETHLVVVADGMGGHRDGALAARTVIETARRHFNGEAIPDPRAFLHGLCLESHRAISDLGGDERFPPGSTCVVLYLDGPEAYWAHVGDSRLYHFRKDKLLGHTQDHSVAQLMAARGRVQESGAATSTLQNQLYMCLGGKDTPDPDFGASEVEADDLFMLCSDGFWSSVEPEEVLKSLETLPVEQDGAGSLVAMAKERGGDTGDNISLALLQWNPGRVRHPQGLKARFVVSIRRLQHHVLSRTGR